MKKVTIIIPTLNAEKFLTKCLISIYKQSLDKSQYEVFVIDGGSIDKTIKIAQSFRKVLPVSVLHNEKIDAESGKRIGIKQSNANYICLLDADNEIVGKEWLSNAVDALDTNDNIWGVESNWITNPNDSYLNQYFSLLKIADPVARVFSPSYTESIKRQTKKYLIISVNKNSTPIIGANGFFYRKKLIQNEITKTDKFEEVNYVSKLISDGHTDYALLKSVGIYHDYCHSVSNYLKKRKKIAKKFLKRKEIKQATWVDKVGIYKFMLSVLYNASIVGPSIEALANVYKTKNLAWLYHPLISCLTVCVYVYYFLLSKLKLSHDNQS